MAKTAVVFPGQGSQRKGMALDFYERFAESKRIFDIASEVLSLDIPQICREGGSQLDLTKFTQPCILTAEIAMAEALRQHFDFKPEYFGGHSLGEYSALVMAGVIPFDVVVQLVHSRGKLMQWSMPAGVGSMAAVIRDGEALPAEEIIELAAKEEVDVANDNSPYQVVLSGVRNRVDKICEKLTARFGGNNFRVVPLATSASFHSRHMAEAESIFSKILQSKASAFNIKNATRVTSNFTGTFHTGVLPDLIDSLVRQISGRVRWRDNMAALKEKAEGFYELGPNRPLAGFFHAVGTSIQSIIDLRSAQRTLALRPEGILS